MTVRNNFRAVTIVLFLICTLLLKPMATQAKQVARPFLIVPGFSIGKVQLGQSQDEVHQKMGRPVKSEARQCMTILFDRKAGGFNYQKAGTFIVDTWVRQSNSGETFEVLYRDNKAAQITTSLSGYKTKEGLSSKSTFDDLVMHFGEVDDANQIWFDHDLERPIGESAMMESYWNFVQYGLTIRSDNYSGYVDDVENIFAISVYYRNRDFLFYDLYQ